MPQFTGKSPVSINITGYIFPWWTDADQPMLVRSHPEDKNPAFMLPIFSTEDKLREAVREWLSPDGPWKIKLIQDGIEFLSSFKRTGLIIAADPHIVNGNTRFVAVFRDIDLN